MFITKLVYAEKDVLPDNIYYFLKRTCTISETEYGTIELRYKDYKALKDDMFEYPDAYDTTWQNIHEELVNAFGSDVMEALENQHIDAVQLI